MTTWQLLFCERTLCTATRQLLFWVRTPCTNKHRWALSPISVISDIGLSLKSELPISDWESGVWHYIGYRNKVLSDILYPTSFNIQTVSVAQWYSASLKNRWTWVRFFKLKYFFLQCRISEWALMSISEHFRYRNDVFQSDIFVSDIGITHVDVGYHRHWGRCRCPPMQTSTRQLLAWVRSSRSPQQNQLNKLETNNTAWHQSHLFIDTIQIKNIPEWGRLLAEVNKIELNY